MIIAYLVVAASVFLFLLGAVLVHLFLGFGRGDDHRRRRPTLDDILFN